MDLDSAIGMDEGGSERDFFVGIRSDQYPRPPTRREPGNNALALHPLYSNLPGHSNHRNAEGDSFIHRFRDNIVEDEADCVQGELGSNPQDTKAVVGHDFQGNIARGTSLMISRTVDMEAATNMMKAKWSSRGKKRDRALDKNLPSSSKAVIGHAGVTKPMSGRKATMHTKRPEQGE